ncbi:MAG: cytidine deaminase [Bacteroidales bacterium]
MIKKQEITLQYLEVPDIRDLPGDEQALVKAAREMIGKAYAPYSSFYVGAAILLQNGEMIRGSNQENGAYPSGLCAERVAAFAASSIFPGVAMTKIAVSAGSPKFHLEAPVSPCGACRQVLLEYEASQQLPMKVLLSKEDGKIIIVETIRDILPLSFIGSELKT